MRDWFPAPRYDALFTHRYVRTPWILLKWLLVPLGAWLFTLYWAEKMGPWTAAWFIGFPLVFGFIEGLQQWRGSRSR